MSRLGFLRCRRQVGSVFLLTFFFASCSRGAEEISLIPPTTDPLNREFIGYGVVNVSFIHVSGDPGPDSASLGYLRKGSMVRVIERRSVANRQNVELWLFVDTEALNGKIAGWLRERDVDIYDNESRARTASEVLSP